MAADDITSQDAAVIGDDLVEALGFEPITADAGNVDEQRETSTSEVAVLEDTSLDSAALDSAGLDAGLDDAPTDEFVEAPDGDDIEIIDDEIAAESDDSDDEAEQLDAELDSTVDDPALDDAALDDAALDDAALDDAAVEETALDDVETEVSEKSDDSSTSLFGAPAPAYVAPTKTADEVDDVDEASSDLSADDAEVALDEGQDDDDSSPVVFFNNAVDTDTAPLPDLDEPESAEPDADDPVVDVDELAGETTELEVTEPDTADLETRELDALASEVAAPDDAQIEIDTETDIDLSDSPPPPGVTNLIDLDRGDDLAVGDKLVDEDTVAVPLQRQPFDAPAKPDLDRGVETQTETAIETADSRVEPVAVPTKGRRKKLRARKSRRVVRHIDPWSVLTFSVLFHLCFFAALLLASVLVWNAALAAGTIENIENFVRELGDYETFEINSDQVFKAATLIAGLLTLASSVLVVLLTVVFNLISDLIGGIRVTVIEEETVRIPRKAQK